MQSGLPIGRMVPRQPPAEPPPAATCARCACRLSRYRGGRERHCSPCRDVLVAEGALRLPAFEPATSSAAQARASITKPRQHCRDCDKPLTRTMNPNASGLCKDCYYANLNLKRAREWACLDCGARLPRSHHKRCLKCCNESKRVYALGSPESSQCKCGAKKKCGAIMCAVCRYGRPRERRAA